MSGHILESCICIAEAEGKMFDSLININMVTSVMEADETDKIDTHNGENDSSTENGSSQNSAEVSSSKIQIIKESIKKIAIKAKELLDKLIAAIANAVQTAVEKIQNFFTTDSKVIAKYGELVKVQSNLDGFEGIDNFQIPKQKTEKAPGNINTMIDDVVKDEEVIAAAMNVEEANQLRDEAVEKVDKYMEEFNNYYGDYFETIEHWVPTAAFMTEAVDAMTIQGNVIKIAKEIMDSTKDSKNLVNKLKTATQFDKLAAKVSTKLTAEQKHIELDVCGAQYTVLSKAASALSKYTSIVISTKVAEFRAYRHAVLTVGKYAADKVAGKETVSEESVCLRYIIGESSDMSVDEVFAY